VGAWKAVREKAKALIVRRRSQEGLKKCNKMEFDMQRQCHRAALYLKSGFGFAALRRPT
jgi:hypothetical protein